MKKNHYSKNEGKLISYLSAKINKTRSLPHSLGWINPRWGRYTWELHINLEEKCSVFLTVSIEF